MHDEMTFPDRNPNLERGLSVSEYIRPVTSDREVMFFVADSLDVVLDRPTVEVLRDWLTIWLEEER